MSDTERLRLAHVVYFTLKDRSDEAAERLVASCDKWLAHQPGVVFYGTGRRGEEFERPVNDKQYDVALHVVFESLAAHDAYQASDDHQAFLAENVPTFESIRVFDTYV